MSGLALGTLVIGGATAYASSQNWWQDVDEEKQSLNLPSFYTDPHYEQTQKDLYGRGKDLLAGKPGDYYGAIGESGGQELEGLIGMTRRDITKSVQESAAKRGTGRGGTLDSVIAGKTADASTQLRYADMMRAMKGREFLLSQGRGMTEGVRDAGLRYGSQRNAFGLTSARIQQSSMESAFDREERSGVREDEMTSDMAGSLTSGALSYLGGAGGFSSGGTDKGDIAYAIAQNNKFNNVRGSAMPRSSLAK